MNFQEILEAGYEPSTTYKNLLKDIQNDGYDVVKVGTRLIDLDSSRTVYYLDHGDNRVIWSLCNCGRNVVISIHSYVHLISKEGHTVAGKVEVE